MASFDRDGLAFFIGGSDKNPPPVFVGRQEVLEDIVGTANRAWTLRDRGESGVTRLIQGAPGAGKSSILTKLEERLNGRRTKAGTPRILKLDYNVLFNPRGFLGLLAKMVNRRRAPNFLMEREETHGSSQDAGTPGVRLSVRRGVRKKAVVPLPDFVAFDAWLESLPFWGKMRHPIIVAVDEAQNLSRDKTGSAAMILAALQNAAPKRPITLVLAGLSNTEQVVAELGLTRGLHFHRIGCLDGNDRIEVVLKYCERFGIEIGSCRGNLEELVQPTDGWPRHLHWVLIALAKAALSKGIDGVLDRITDWNELERESQQSRNDYYLRQQYGPMVDSAYLVSAVIQQLDKELTPGEVKQVIEENEGKSKLWRIPAKMDSDQFYDHLVHRGALEVLGNGFVHCPIPSFRKFLISKGPPRDCP